MKIQNMFCFWSQVFFQLVKFAVEKWPTPGTKSGVFRYLKKNLKSANFLFKFPFSSKKAKLNVKLK